MPKHPWDIGDWEARIKATGPIEWEQVDQRSVDAGEKPPTTHKYRLCKRDGRWAKEIYTGVPDVSTRSLWGFCHNPDHGAYYTDHEAACLIREHWHSWLRQRLATVYWHVESAQYIVYVRGKFIGAFDDIDTAQAAAVDAVLAEGDRNGKQDD